MFDLVTRHKKLIQIVLAILFLPFAFFGVDVYFRDMGGGQEVARVGNYVISQEEFSRALRERQQALQNSMQGRRIDPALLDNPEMRQATLENLIQRRLLIERALARGVTVSDDQLKSIIGEQAAFRDENGKFSYPRYEQFLKSEGMTPAIFESRMRQDMLLRQMSAGYADSSFVPRAVAELLLRLSGQQREISHATFSPDVFLAQIKPDPEAAKKHYDANPGEFRVPEQARVEYVTLSVEGLMEGVQVDPAEARKYYDTNRRQFGVEESRQAAHILVSFEAGAGPEAKQKARLKADGIYSELQKNPGGFAAAAKNYSNDPGSAANGGDLGRISRGSMKEAPAFEQALFQMKPGEISPPVESQLGFHIIRLVSIQPSQVKPFEEVRGQIERDLRKQLAARRFAELADGFSNAVYEQSESLKPAASLANTAVRQSGWITRERAEAPLNNPKLIAAIFSDEVLKDRRNTEAVEVASGTMVSARVIEAKPSSIQPFEEVRAGLEKRLALREAARLAAEEGRRKLEELKQGKPVKIAWSAPQLVDRNDRNIPEPVLRQAFRMDASKLPVYAGVDSPRGAFVLLRVTKVQEDANIPPEKAKALAEQLRNLQGQEALVAYVASLKQKAGVRISKEMLEKKDR
jgi:peptidyl-prolyl cis-trans isomerase D